VTLPVVCEKIRPTATMKIANTEGMRFSFISKSPSG
jgi:hypothetical protein